MSINKKDGPMGDHVESSHNSTWPNLDAEQVRAIYTTPGLLPVHRMDIVIRPLDNDRFTVRTKNLTLACVNAINERLPKPR